MRNIDDLEIRGGTPRSRESVDRLQEILAIQIPDGLKDIALRYDGGSPEVGVFDFGGETTAISDFLRLTDDPSDPLGMIFLTKNVPNLPPKLVPFARDAGDWLLCLDYSHQPDPRVVVYVPTEQRVTPVANSFETFLNSLYA